MNGVHDMGGMHGMGPIEREPDEPVFHHPWEARVLAITLATGSLGRWNIDMSRHAREQMPAADYLAASYYERWLSGLELLLRKHGLVAPGEVEARARDPRPARPPAEPPPGARVLRAAGVAPLLARPGNAYAGPGEDTAPPRFAPGDRVRARNVHPIGHTRLPRYARGRAGAIDRDHGLWVFAAAAAAGLGKQPQRVYSVRFTAQALWGPDADPRDAVYIDLWDDYLEPA